MYYHKLYKEYMMQLNALKIHIKTLKKGAKSERQCQSLKSRISILYAMYLDMKHTCEYLKIRCEELKK